jgi:hypothetical protein
MHIMCLHYYLVPILVLTVDGYFLINLLYVVVTNICQSQSLLCVVLTTILFHMHNMCLMHLLCVQIMVTIWDFAGVNNSKYVKQLTWTKAVIQSSFHHNNIFHLTLRKCYVLMVWRRYLIIWDNETGLERINAIFRRQWTPFYGCDLSPTGPEPPLLSIYPSRENPNLWATLKQMEKNHYEW